MGLIVEVGTREVAPSVFKGYLKVLDGEKNMHDALTNNAGLGATVYAFHDKGAYGSATQHTFGEWSHSPSNSGGATGTTTFQDTAGDIKTFMKGWLLVPAVQELGYLEITDVDTSLDKVVVKGDADSLSGIGQRYWLVAPAGVDPATGALETDPCKMGSLWLWAGYHYRAPIVGFHTTPPSQSAGTYGAQTGNNKLGNYYCWNRIYEPSTCRWTTPDPAMAPWSNLWDYCNSNPPSTSDTSGLDPFGSPTGHPVGSIPDFLERNRRIQDEFKRADAAGGVFFEIVLPPFNPTPDAGDCGNFNFKVKWGLHNKQNASGWLIQEVDTTYHIVDCDGAVVMDQRLHYWEAWPDKDGNVYAGAAHFNEIQAGTRAGFDNF